MTHSDYEKLLQEIRRHDRLYYVENRPEISDYAYDQLYKRLEKIEEDHPDWVTPTSPTQRVGAALHGGFKQKKHTVPMMSLANTYSLEEVDDFLARVNKLLEGRKAHFCAELKMDGVAVTVRYEEGLYVQALTRGDGEKGDDITANLKTVRAVPLELHGSHIPKVLEVRGEVFMTHAVFQAQNSAKEEAGEEVWANPRNAAAGSLKLLDPHEVAKRNLSAVFYGIADTSHPPVSLQSEVHEFLHHRGLPTFARKHWAPCDGREEIARFAANIEKERDSLPFDIDGIVIKLDPLKYHEMLGATGKSPRWAVAYKFSPEQATTEILDITVQVGRTGVLTPVAELKPVLLAGSTISRATLHNEEEIERKDIRIGDTVTIEKGGDVIPKVVSIDRRRRPHGLIPWKMPKKCPSCGETVIRSEEEVAVRCPNTSGCTEQKIRRLAFFASKEAMDIHHLGNKVAELLVQSGLVNQISDLYTLTAHDLEKLEGFKEKSIDNLLKSIEASRRVSLSRLILALGIRYIGKETAELLAEQAGSLEKLAEMSREELLAIEGVGAKMAEAIAHDFRTPAFRREVAALLKLGVRPEPPKKSHRTDHPFYGKHFVLTGTLSDSTRSQAAELIKERGGKVSGSVSSTTDYLVVGEEAGSKLDRAKKLGVRCLTEKEFRQLL
jgi:DNA ligase (NAD+)